MNRHFRLQDGAIAEQRGQGQTGRPAGRSEEDQTTKKQQAAGTARRGQTAGYWANQWFSLQHRM